MSLDDKDEIDYARLTQYYANSESDGEAPDFVGSDDSGVMGALDAISESLRNEQSATRIKENPCLPAFVTSFVGPALLSGQWDKQEVFDLFVAFKKLVNGRS